MFTITCTLATIQLAVCERYEHINNEYSVSLPSAGLLMSGHVCSRLLASESAGDYQHPAWHSLAKAACCTPLQYVLQYVLYLQVVLLHAEYPHLLLLVSPPATFTTSRLMIVSRDPGAAAATGIQDR